MEKKILQVMETILKLLLLFFLLFNSLCFSDAIFKTTIKDPTGRSFTCFSNLEFLNPQTQTELAIIVIHGFERKGELNLKRMMNAAKLSEKEKVSLIIAPQFNTAQEGPLPNEHFWSKESWPSGGLSEDEKDETKRLSSFALVDLLFAELADTKRFPKLQRIVLAGHSAGGQFVNRYVAVGKAGDDFFQTRGHLKRLFLVANPSSYLYLDGRRPLLGTNRFEIPNQPPENYNRWRHGLENRNAYASRLSIDEITTNVSKRRTYYLVGSEDNKQDDYLSNSPPSMVQGKNRHDRWENYRGYVNLFPAWRQSVEFVEVPGAEHSNRQIYESSIARKIIFE